MRLTLIFFMLLPATASAFCSVPMLSGRNSYQDQMLQQQFQTCLQNERFQQQQMQQQQFQPQQQSQQSGINFGLLNTNAPHEIGTSFQRGRDDALRRQQMEIQLEMQKLQLRQMQQQRGTEP